jgi:hypothetical protein
MHSIANQKIKEQRRFAPVMNDCRITPSAYPTYETFPGDPAILRNIWRCRGVFRDASQRKPSVARGAGGGRRSDSAFGSIQRSDP